MFIAVVLIWTHPGINLSAGAQRTEQYRKFHRCSRKDAFLLQRQQQKEENDAHSFICDSLFEKGLVSRYSIAVDTLTKVITSASSKQALSESSELRTARGTK